MNGKDQRSGDARGTLTAPAAARPKPAPPALEPLSVEAPGRKTPAAERSTDPYNTSGSFDRTKNWTRVGKR